MTSWPSISIKLGGSVHTYMRKLSSNFHVLMANTRRGMRVERKLNFFPSSDRTFPLENDQKGSRGINNFLTFDLDKIWRESAGLLDEAGYQVS